MTEAATGPGALNEERRDRRWVFYYDGDCGLCTTAVRRLSRLDFRRRVRWVAFQALPEPPQGLSWEDLDRAAYLDTGKGGLQEGFQAFRALTLALPPLLPLAPLLWLPGMGPLGTAVYRWVARNRCRLWPRS